MAAKTSPAQDPEVASVLKISERLDTELKELPIETHSAIINVLSQLAEHRIAMVQREARKQAEQKQREAQFAPLAAKPH